jgi:nucleoside-diphosphate-sugar epimerase
MHAMNNSSVDFNYIERPAVDVEKTWADTSKLEGLLGSVPHTDVNEGIRNFIDWFKAQPTEIRRYKPI